MKTDLLTQERKAKLEKEALDLIQKIQDERIRSYYTKEVKKQLFLLEKEKKKQNLSFNDAQNILKPQKNTIEGRMLLSYLLCYPNYAQNFIEEIASIHLQDKALQSTKEKLLEHLFENPNISAQDLEQLIFEDSNDLKLPEMEMLKKSNKSQEDVYHDIRHWLHIYQIRSLEEECNNKVMQYNETGDSSLWQDIQNIKNELITLKNQE